MWNLAIINVSGQLYIYEHFAWKCVLSSVSVRMFHSSSPFFNMLNLSSSVFLSTKGHKISCALYISQCNICILSFYPHSFFNCQHLVLIKGPSGYPYPAPPPPPPQQTESCMRATLPIFYLRGESWLMNPVTVKRELLQGGGCFFWTEGNKLRTFWMCQPSSLSPWFKWHSVAPNFHPETFIFFFFHVLKRSSTCPLAQILLGTGKKGSGRCPVETDWVVCVLTCSPSDSFSCVTLNTKSQPFKCMKFLWVSANPLKPACISSSCLAGPAQGFPSLLSLSVYLSWHLLPPCSPPGPSFSFSPTSECAVRLQMAWTSAHAQYSTSQPHTYLWPSPAAAVQTYRKPAFLYTLCLPVCLASATDCGIAAIMGWQC